MRLPQIAATVLQHSAPRDRPNRGDETHTDADVHSER